MKKIYLLLITTVLSLFGTYGQVPVITVTPLTVNETVKVDSVKTVKLIISNIGNRDLDWTISGETVVFNKPDGANYKLPVNQDRITDNVWITRAFERGIFNIKIEDSYRKSTSPVGTEWAYGRTIDNGPGDYTFWRDAIGNDPPSMIGNTYSMHLIEDDQYYDVLLNSWGIGDDGGEGGFAYTRTRVIPWIRPQDEEGSTLPGETSEVNIDLDASNLVIGTYSGSIVIKSNDPAHMEIPVSFTIQVINGKPNFSVSINALYFDNVPVTGTKVIPLLIYNNDGRDDLNITGISNASSVFTLAKTNITIKPNKFATISVGFSPADLLGYQDTIRFSTNDTIFPAIEIALQGTGIEKPKISVDVPSFNITMGANKIDSFKLTISDTGATDLSWTIKDNILSASKVSFTKLDYADWTLPKNQDRLSPSVTITRQNNEGIFNITQESSYERGGAWRSPLGTLWAFGNSANLTPADYGLWRDIVRTDERTYEMVNQQMSMYLIDEDKYIDIMFKHWTTENTGGGFSYIRDATSGFIGLSLRSGTTSPFGSQDIDVIFNSAGMKAGVYQAAIIISSDDPDNPVITVPVTLNITGAPELNANNSIDFGDIMFSQSKTIQFKVNNEGTDTLKMSNLKNDSASFSVLNYVKNILPDSSGIITLKCTPNTTGLKTDTLVFNTNDTLNPVFKIYLSCNSYTPPAIDVATLPYSISLVSGSSKTIDITVGNDGIYNLIGEITCTSGDSVSFAKDSYTDVSLPENQDHITPYIWITRGVRQGIFNIKEESSYDDGSPKGTLWTRGMTITHEPGDYENWRDAVYPPPSQVGAIVSMHAIEEDRYFDFAFSEWGIGRNIDAEPGGSLAYKRVEIPKWVKVNSGSDFNVAGDDSETITLTITAEKVYKGVYNAILHIVSNDLNRPVILVPIQLTVTGVPEINTDTLLQFGNSQKGGIYTKDLVIRNTGGDTLKVTNISHGASAFSITSTAFTVMAGDSINLPVTYSPVAEQSDIDTFTIASNDAINPIVKFVATGTGIPSPVIAINLAKIDTSLFPDSIATFRLIIQNSGNADLTWSINSKISFAKDDYADWTLKENQDSISPTVAITRADNQGIFNIYKESSFDQSVSPWPSPAGTLWAFGNSLDLKYSDYGLWRKIVRNEGYTYEMVNKPMSMYLVNEKIYYNVMFTDWTSGNNGGGFAYTRSVPLLDADWLTFSSMKDTVKTSASADTITVTINTVGLLGKYKAVFNLSSNDPAKGEILIPVNLNVGGILLGTPLADIRKNEGFVSDTVDFSKTFIYQDVASTDVKVVSQHNSVITVDTLERNVIITEQGAGNSYVSLRADDHNGTVIFADFLYKVNAGPVATNPIPDTYINAGFGTKSIDLNSVFTDVNEDVLSFSASSSKTSVLTTGISGNTLLLNEVSYGTTTVTVIANDGLALPDTDEFKVVINRVPTVKNAIGDVVINKGFGTYPVNLTNVFEDPDGNSMTYTASSSKNNIVTASVSGASLTIHEVGVGVSVIKVTANDGMGGTVSASFTFTVNNPNEVNFAPEHSISLYPNPTSGKVNLKLDNSIQGELIVNVTDVIGKEVFIRKINAAQGIVQLDLTGLDKGMYIISINKVNKQILKSEIVIK